MLHFKEVINHTSTPCCLIVNFVSFQSVELLSYSFTGLCLLRRVASTSSIKYLSKYHVPKFN